MAQWMQCSFVGSTITWADSTCSLPTPDTTDTHDGFDDERVRRRVRADEERFKSERERLRETIARAYDPEHGKVAEEVQALAAPYVERLESGTPRIDYAALERNARVIAEILAYADALAAEYEARAADDDDEDVMLLTTLWS